MPLADLHRLREPVLAVGGKPDALLLGQLEHGAQPQRPVEMAVQVGLRERVEQLVRDGDVGDHLPKGSNASAGPDHAIFPP